MSLRLKIMQVGKTAGTVIVFDLGKEINSKFLKTYLRFFLPPPPADLIREFVKNDVLVICCVFVIIIMSQQLQKLLEFINLHKIN